MWLTISKREKRAIDMAPGAIAARDTMKRMLGEALAAGSEALARNISSDLRRMEKLISKYGLERYADRT
jgi:hypothetical protein